MMTSPRGQDAALQVGHGRGRDTRPPAVRQGVLEALELRGEVPVRRGERLVVEPVHGLERGHGQNGAEQQGQEPSQSRGRTDPVPPRAAAGLRMHGVPHSFRGCVVVVTPLVGTVVAVGPTVVVLTSVPEPGEVSSGCGADGWVGIVGVPTDRAAGTIRGMTAVSPWAEVDGGSVITGRDGDTTVAGTFAATGGEEMDAGAGLPRGYFPHRPRHLHG